MKNMRILGYPGLCLCLGFWFLLVSCAAKHQSLKLAAAVSSDTSVCLYKLEILVMPVKWAVSMRDNDGWLNFQQYNVVKLASYSNSHAFSLLYRTNDIALVQLFKEQLLGTGIVKQVNIVKMTN